MKERIERNKELYEKYGSWVLLHSPWTGKLPDGEDKFQHSVYDELPSGWAEAFGMDMIEELGAEIDEKGLREKYYTTQINRLESRAQTCLNQSLSCFFYITY